MRWVRQGLAFLALRWGFYALLRTVTVFTKGALEAFGRQWLLIESIFLLIALALLWANRNATR